MPKVFISYSHDSEEHRARVLALADRLNRQHVDCEIDQYVQGTPAEGWPIWMERMMEQSVFVLVVCTEVYLKRVKREEPSGVGKGVKWESLLSYQQIYDNDSLNLKFVPLVFAPSDAAHIPAPLKAATYYNPTDEEGYLALYRYLSGQPRAIKPKPEDRLELPPLNQQSAGNRPQKLIIDRLPTVIGDFFGREKELQLLDDALAAAQANPDNPPTRIIQFIAAGGTGKTKLLRHWLNQHDAELGDRIIWSFYSQGTSENKQVSASPLFTEAFKQLGLDPGAYTTDEDRADALAEQLAARRCLLVLDGLEPLQHGGKGMDGRLKERAMARLLKRLALSHSHLCIITSRISVYDIADRPCIQSHPLDNLTSEDGVRLLDSLGVQGPLREKERAVEEVEGHALTLHLLGNAVRTYLGRDIRRRDTLDTLIDDADGPGRHAFKVMQGYQQWLTDEQGQPLPELRLLYLLGLFVHPIDREVLEVLWQAQIEGLTDCISQRAWQVAIRDLQEKHRLLSEHPARPGLLDCHPLIREFFGGQLQRHQPEVWREAHERLYDYYRNLPEKELPDTLEEMQPLLAAVTHGCAAGEHQRTLVEVYYPRIQRDGGTNYLCEKIGYYNDDLAAVAHFFSIPWNTPATGMEKMWQAGVLNWAGFRLRALGRLREAFEPMQAHIEISLNMENWIEVAKGAGNLSELELTFGQVAVAVETGRLAVEFADRSGDGFMRMYSRTVLADVLHQTGNWTVALALFREAERIQQERQPSYFRLYSVQGFRYCDLLLAQSERVEEGIVEVLERAQQTLEWLIQNHMSLLSIGLDQLTLARANLLHNFLTDRENVGLVSDSVTRQNGLKNGTLTNLLDEDLSEARNWSVQAVAGLRASQRQDYLPRALLVQATLHRLTAEYPQAHDALQEVYDIAEPSGMRLHLTDYHLESARLFLAEYNSEQAREHADLADALIQATGYHRRDDELAELRRHLAQG